MFSVLRADIITPHITDSRALEIPCLKPGFACHYDLPQWEPIRIGSLVLDLSPTKHVVFAILAAVVCCVVLIAGARLGARKRTANGVPQGFSNAIEAMVLYLRNEVFLPNLGAGGDRYVPFLLTLFFFILFGNLLGLVPYGSAATSNIAVTVSLATLTFIVTEIAGMRALGKSYIGTIIYWPSDLHIAIKLPMTLVMTPVEIISKFTKPFALAIRLFANMTAGHVVILALVGLIFTFGSYIALPGPIAMATAIMVLKIFVSFLQAFIFTLLSSVFIGQIREAAH